MHDGRRCRENLAHIRQSQPDSGLSVQDKILETIKVVPPWLGSGTAFGLKLRCWMWGVLPRTSFRTILGGPQFCASFFRRDQIWQGLALWDGQGTAAVDHDHVAGVQVQERRGLQSKTPAVSEFRVQGSGFVLQHSGCMFVISIVVAMPDSIAEIKVESESRKSQRNREPP